MIIMMNVIVIIMIVLQTIPRDFFLTQPFSKVIFVLLFRRFTQAFNQSLCGVKSETVMGQTVCSSAICLFVGWLLNVPATCECISGTDLHRQFYVLPH